MNNKKLFIEKMCEEFKAYCIDCIDEGYDEECEDHFDFMERALDVFIEQKQSEES